MNKLELPPNFGFPTLNYLKAIFWEKKRRSEETKKKEDDEASFQHKHPIDRRKYESGQNLIWQSLPS